MKKSRLAVSISIIVIVILAVLVGILLLGRHTQVTDKQPAHTTSQAQSSPSQESSQSQAAVSSSTAAPSQQSSSEPETTQQSAESSSTSAATSVSEKNDHANLESRDQPVTISARDIQATRSILKNAGIDDKKFTDKQIEDLMNQSIATGKPIPDLAR